MRRPQLALANTADLLVTAAATGQTATVDFRDRTIRGLIVPFGKIGRTSVGAVTYSRGAIRWTDPSRVKLLVEHNQGDPVGYATELTETDEGVWATFHVPAGPEGDRVLSQASTKVRDGLSIGVQLDDKVVRQLRSANGGAVAGAGDLRETSVVSVPAFDDARVAAVANTDLVVSSWSDATTSEGTPMFCSSCNRQHAPEAACLAVATVPAQPAPNPAPTPTPAPTDPATPTQPAPAQPAAPAQPPATPAPEAAPLATAGAATLTVNAEASVYTFGADGPSLVHDAWNARTHSDSEAAQRLAQFNAQLLDGNRPSVMALAAVLTTEDVEAEGPPIIPVVRRPDLIRLTIDRGRPITARLPKVPISNATPFYIPTGVAEFDGVADHVEGTAHVAEGALTFPSEVLFSPKAVSGAFRLSREIVDASNPAIDRVALAAMLKDYRRKTEVKSVAAVLAADAVVTGSIDGVNKLREQLMNFGDDDIEAALVLVGKAFFGALALDNDTTERPLLPYVGPTNAAGTIRAGYTGLSLDGTEIVKSSAMPTDDAVIMDPDGFLVAESATQTFRFDEVEGPGIIKLALFGYFGVAQLTPNTVTRLRRTVVA